MIRCFGCKNKDNRGMSLVEIIIVIAIMSVFIGVSGYGLSLSNNKAAAECAQKLCSALQHTRTVTMGKHETSLTLYMDAEGRIRVREVAQKLIDDDGNVELEERPSIVGENGVFVSCTLTDGSSVDISETNNITFSFNRGSGALEATYVNAVKCDENCNCRQITISKAGRTQYIVIVPVTGKIMITNTP